MIIFTTRLNPSMQFLKQLLKVFISVPVLACLMFGVINQSLCGGEGYYYRFTKVEIALVNLSEKIDNDTFNYVYPERKTVVDTTRFYEVDVPHAGSSANSLGVLISFGIDYCNQGASNIAYAAVEPGGGGCLHELKAVQLFSVEGNNSLVDITPEAYGVDSILRYQWKSAGEPDPEYTRSSGLLSDFKDSFNLSWRHEPPLPHYTKGISFLYVLSQETLARIPNHYHLKLRVEFTDGHIVESECSGIK